MRCEAHTRMLLREAMHGESTQALSRGRAVQAGGRKRPSRRLRALGEVLGMLPRTRERTKDSLLRGPSDQVRLS